jgi:hypothetical protein
LVIFSLRLKKFELIDVSSPGQKSSKIEPARGRVWKKLPKTFAAPWAISS